MTFLSPGKVLILLLPLASLLRPSSVAMLGGPWLLAIVRRGNGIAGIVIDTSVGIGRHRILQRDVGRHLGVGDLLARPPIPASAEEADRQLHF